MDTPLSPPPQSKSGCAETDMITIRELEVLTLESRECNGPLPNLVFMYVCDFLGSAAWKP